MVECSLDGCSVRARGRGLCNPHYQRALRAGTLPPSFTTEDRFWAKVKKTETCWLFTAAGGKYGYFWDGEKLTLAHRYAWELLVGPIPEGLTIDHVVCFTYRCVNPAHLEVVTLAVNIQRAWARRKVT